MKIYGNKEARKAYEMIHEGKNKVICVRVDYDTHIRVNNNPHIMRKCGIDCIRNNFMKFYPKKELKWNHFLFILAPKIDSAKPYVHLT